jgi:hypothetical protein
MEMNLSRAEVPTANAVSYLRQLCRHWSHKFPVEFDDTHGKIQLPAAVVQLMSSPAALWVYLEVAAAEDQERMEEVVAEHLQRCGCRETLEFRWLRS